MLKKEIPRNVYLKLIFDYKDYGKEIWSEQLWYLLNEPRFEGQVDIVKGIEWLFFTTNSLYTMIGIHGDELWCVEEDGDLFKADIKLQELPFHINYHPTDNEFWIWSRREELAKAFLYYFDYCEKNSIRLSPENLAWKEPLLKFIKDNE